jgi:hypothetical protein
MKLKYEDLKKLTDYLEKNCRCAPVIAEPNHIGSAMIFKVTNTLGENLTITLYDDKNYLAPKIVKEENL